MKTAPHVTVARVARWMTDERNGTGSAVIARRLASGEVVNLGALTAELGVSYSLATVTIKDMRVAGYRFDTGRGTAQLIGKDEPSFPEPSSFPPVNGNGKHPRSHPKAVAAPVRAPDLAPLRHPTVGGMLQVRAVVLNNGALEVMAVDSDGHAWQLGIIGQT